MTAPVVVFGALNTTLLIIGGVFLAAGAGTDAAGATICPVDTAAGKEVAAPGTPSSRRAAASITHDTGDCAGATGPVPSSGVHTDSTSPAAAVFGGAATMTGCAATGGATMGGTDTTGGPGTAASGVCRPPLDSGPPGGSASTTKDPVSPGVSAVMPRGDARRSPESNCGVEADSAGPVLSSWSAEGPCGGSVSPRLLRRGVAAAGDGIRAFSATEAGASASRGGRVTPLRACGRRDCDGVDADSVEASALSADEDESAGAAHAVPPPPMNIPTPKITARPPTRPTNAEAPNSPTP